MESFRLILISLDASAAVRFKRAKNKYEIKDLETFIQVDHEFQSLLHSSHSYKMAFTILNNHDTVEDLHV